MPRTPRPITYPNRGPGRARYDNTRRWLERHTGPKVRTEAQLLRALQQPEVFYIVPQEFRKGEPPPQPGNDVRSEVLK